MGYQGWVRWLVVGSGRYLGAEKAASSREAGVRVITVAELEQMTPEDRERTFKDSIVRDLDDVPERFRPVMEAQRDRVLEREAGLRGNAS